VFGDEMISTWVSQMLFFMTFAVLVIALVEIPFVCLICWIGKQAVSQGWRFLSYAMDSDFKGMRETHCRP
jgi:hypothetical protein